MAIVKESRFDRVEVLSSGVLQVRDVTEVKEDGIVIASNYHRHIIEPGDNYSAEGPEVTAIAGVVHTPAKIAEYESYKAALLAKTQGK